MKISDIRVGIPVPKGQLPSPPFACSTAPSTTTEAKDKKQTRSEPLFASLCTDADRLEIPFYNANCYSLPPQVRMPAELNSHPRDIGPRLCFPDGQNTSPRDVEARLCFPGGRPVPQLSDLILAQKVIENQLFDPAHMAYWWPSVTPLERSAVKVLSNVDEGNAESRTIKRAVSLRVRVPKDSSMPNTKFCSSVTVKYAYAVLSRRPMSGDFALRHVWNVIAYDQESSLSFDDDEKLDA